MGKGLWVSPSTAESWHRSCTAASWDFTALRGRERAKSVYMVD